jgi:hypothetical protein
MNAAGGWLQLAEVELYDAAGAKVPGSALNATQSSVGTAGFGRYAWAENAVDGAWAGWGWGWRGPCHQAGERLLDRGRECAAAGGGLPACPRARAVCVPAEGCQVPHALVQGAVRCPPWQ